MTNVLIFPSAWGLRPIERRFLAALLDAHGVCGVRAIMANLYADRFEADWPHASIVKVLTCTTRKKLAKVFGAETVIIETAYTRGAFISEPMKTLVKAFCERGTPRETVSPGTIAA